MMLVSVGENRRDDLGDGKWEKIQSLLTSSPKRPLAFELESLNLLKDLTPCDREGHQATMCVDSSEDKVAWSIRR